MKKLLIIVLVSIAVITRLVGLNHFPDTLNRDEVAIGYNAYSILQTSKDEHGQKFPLNFESIGDYKMPLYIYATILPVKLFGLSNFSIKFWSAVSGLVSIIFIYFLSKKLFDSSKVALLSGILMTLNSWAVFYSRIGFEANFSLGLSLIGLNLILSKKTLIKIIGFTLLLLAGLGYSSALIILPPLVLSILLFKRTSILSSQKHTLFYFVYFVLFALEFYLLWSVSSTKSTISIFSNPTLINQFNTLRFQTAQTYPLWAQLWLNKYFYLLRMFIKNYLNTFSIEFLLTQGGGHPWHRIPGTGHFYIPEIFFFIVGLFYLIKDKKININYKHITLAWLFLSPLASAITIDAPHTTRLLYLLPVILILSAYGFTKLASKSKIITIFAVLIYFINVTYVSHQYLRVYQNTVYHDIPKGLPSIIKQINFQDYQHIYFLDKLDYQYLYFAFYSQYPPDQFQQEAKWTGKDLIGITQVHSFGNFSIIDTIKDANQSGLIIVPIDERDKLSAKTLKFANQYYQVYSTN